jgi:hypothetical protein
MPAGRCGGFSARVPAAAEERKGFFFEKKKQKTLTPMGFGTAHAQTLNSQKFFASFFQKRSAYFTF